MAFGSSQMNAMMSGFGALSSYITAGKQAKQDELWRVYNNKMVRIQEGMNQGIITTNALMRKDRKTAQLQQIAKSSTATIASAEVSAAATGTVGRSVNMVLMDIGRNADNMVSDVERDDDMQDVRDANQRMQTAFGAEMQINNTPVQGPSMASLMLGLGKSAAQWQMR